MYTLHVVDSIVAYNNDNNIIPELKIYRHVRDYVC